MEKSNILDENPLNYIDDFFNKIEKYKNIDSFEEKNKKNKPWIN